MLLMISYGHMSESDFYFCLIQALVWYVVYVPRYMDFMMSARGSMEMLMHGGTVQMFLTI